MKFLILVSSILLSASVIADSGQLDLEFIQAKRGDVLAQFRVASAYEFGTDITKDLSKALYWYHKAANQSHAGSQFKIGYFYEYGIGVKTNSNTAMLWYKKAKDNGSKLAIKRLSKKTIITKKKIDKPIKIKIVKKSVPVKTSIKEKKITKVKKTTQERKYTKNKTKLKPNVKTTKPLLLNVKGIILSHNWKNKHGSADYLPSASTTCLSTGSNELTCFSNEKARKIQNTKITYTTKSKISNFKSNGSFYVTYNYNGINISGSTNKANIYGLNSKKGWQQPAIKVKCKASNKKNITCFYGKKKIRFYN
ncbi:MAG: tetratricopeptide repeat protein [Woeseiaceae bacterium]